VNPDIYISPLTNDLDIVRGRLRLTQNDGEEVRQKVSITLNTFRGEWIFNINYGIPWLSNENNSLQLLDKTSKTILDYEIKRAIVNTTGVRSLYSYGSIYDPMSREVAVDLKVEIDTDNIITIDGIQASLGGL